MYAIGISQSDLPPMLLDSPPYGTLFHKVNKWRANGLKKARYAACLYKAHQTVEGGWIWKRTAVICETRQYKWQAEKDALVLSERYGQCQVFNSGLGGKVIT